MNIFFLLLLLPLASWAKAPSQEVLQKLLLPLITCPEKVWPGYSPLKDADFIINVPSENKSLIIKHDGSIEEKTSEEWGDEGLSPYSFGEKNGRKYVIANFEDYENEEQAIQTLFHEGFHYLGQEGIMPSTGRDELLPLDYEARVARAMQLRNMRSYLKDKKDENLHKSAYWENWIKKNRPEEHKANQDWDVLEGSAEFAGLMSTAVTLLGCEASDDALINKILEISEDDMDTSDRSGQSYSAGLMGYMLSRINSTNEVFTEMNRSPLSAALIDCPEIRESPDQSIAETLRVMYSPLEGAVNTAVSELLSSSGLVALPAKSLVGAFQSMGFYSTIVNGERAQVLPQTTMRISIDGKSYHIDSKNIWDSKTTAFCGESYLMLIPKESIPEITNLREDSTFLGKKVYCPVVMNP